jgi:hypothetical protein
MSDSERQQILKMIDEGKITAEEGLKLMQAIGDDEEFADDEGMAGPTEPGGEAASSDAGDPFGRSESEKTESNAYFARKIDRFRHLWQLPLWIGVAVTIGAASWMYSALQNTGFGFWFYCSWLPFLLGVAVVALAFSSRTSRWIYVNVKQKPGERPQRIVITFPLSLVSWLLQIFGNYIPAQQKGVTDDVMRAIFDSTKSDEPILVDVHDDDGEDVQVYIG